MLVLKQKKTTRQTQSIEDPPPTESREVAAIRGLLARSLKQKLSRVQARDIAWYEKQIADKTLAEYLQAVPKGEYCDMAGRQRKVIDDSARLFGFPIGGPTINLFDAVRSLHDFIAANSAKLREKDVDGDREELEDEKLRQQIFKLKIEKDRLMILLQRDRGDSIDRLQLAGALAEVFATVREYGRVFDRLGKETGKLFNDMLDSVASEIESGRLKF